MTTSPAVVASRTFVTCVSATTPLPGNGVSFCCACGAAAAPLGAGALAAGAAEFPSPPRPQPDSTSAKAAANGSTNAIFISASPQDLERLYLAAIARGNRGL